MIQKTTILIFVAAMGCWGLLCKGAMGAEYCSNHAEVDNLDKCKFFYFFRSDEAPADKRISNNLQIRRGDYSRSIALLVGIDSYPNLEVTTLEPAKKDVDHLEQFLKDNQSFDEVIVLRNEDATQQNISYFLRNYFGSRAALYLGKARIIFAYSGHGVESHDAIPGSLVLSAAFGDTDKDNLFSLGELHSILKDLARSSFHVLALINACYGGDIFGVGDTGSNEFNTRERGAHIVTAGRNDQPVWSLGGADQGSIFFDTLIEGITSPTTPAWPVVISSTDKEVLMYGGVITLGDIVGYLTKRFNNFIENSVTSLTYNQIYTVPWVGTVEPGGVHANGAFFFLGPVHHNDSELTSKDTWQVPSGIELSQLDKLSGNVIVHQPDKLVFNQPGLYSKRGFEISEHNGHADFQRVQKAGIDYIFVRSSVGSDYKDPNYKENIGGARVAGIKAGALHTFDYCANAAEQMKNVRSVVEPGSSSLPITLQFPSPGRGAEKECSRKAGWQRQALKMAAAIQKAYGKSPIINTSRYVTENIKLESAFAKFPIMLGDGRQQPSVNLGLKAPWSFWQFTDRAAVDGISGPVAASVFFGNSSQLMWLERGKNVALLAVEGKKPASVDRDAASTKRSRTVGAPRKSKPVSQAPIVSQAVNKPKTKPTNVVGGGANNGGGASHGKGAESSTSR
ncbi:GH25 family lysozyme [Mesorhizobium sp. B2-6-1]|uniref:GH25 family lysozyme n=1 Tax=Mesorhizobium sp. B2-6-1 TaxID=2589916 RepID=UPI001126CBD1|nr:GH25 family lysozyme [Mesorhizobium sp. B2-6-1]TPJ65486.1 hypothetical protein FJ443_06150 [Mesorhizobium sp. B2-6-1]